MFMFPSRWRATWWASTPRAAMVVGEHGNADRDEPHIKTAANVRDFA
jgi:hypothetical protein